ACGPRARPGGGLRPACAEAHRAGRARPAARRLAPHQQPATHFPLPSNSMVRPLSGTCTGALTAFWKAAVFDLGRSLPSFVAASLACEGITDFGFTSWLMTCAASFGPVVKTSPMFMTARFAL